MKPSGYLVMFIDDAIVMPYERDPDCDGALRCLGLGPVVIFPDRKSAQKAITISRRCAELEKEQGKTYNEDFILYKESIRILPVCFSNGEA